MDIFGQSFKRQRQVVSSWGRPAITSRLSVCGKVLEAQSRLIRQGQAIDAHDMMGGYSAGRKVACRWTEGFCDHVATNMAMLPEACRGDSGRPNELDAGQYTACGSNQAGQAGQGPSRQSTRLGGGHCDLMTGNLREMESISFLRCPGPEGSHVPRQGSLVTGSVCAMPSRVRCTASHQLRCFCNRAQIPMAGREERKIMRIAN
jgi:hypothetical protein